jgi:putative ABC transport system permease protein
MSGQAILKLDGDAQLIIQVTGRSDAREKARRLKEAVAAKRLFEDTELTLNTLALKLNIHPHELSRIINVGLEKNFSDFINDFRVREIIRKMYDPAYDRFTLLGLAYESGFNSERTFHRVFKEITGKTPLEYKNSLRKELPIDNLAIPSRIRPLKLRSESPLSRAPRKINRNYMFKNYLKTTFRYLLQHKAYSFINIAGLSIGLACAMLILLYVQDEISYDRFHEQASLIYRIDKQTTKDDGSVSDGSYTGYFPGPRFSANIPEIKKFARFQPSQADIKTGVGIESQAVYFVDTTFFSVFNFPLLTGDAKSVLAEPNSAVITEEMAKKYFGSSNAVGKIISIKQDSVFKPYYITGIAKNCPQNSSIKFQILLPLKISAADESNIGNWFNSFLSTFIVLSPGADIRAVQNKMAKVFESDAGKAISEIKNKYKVKNIGIAYLLEPLTDIHLGKMVPQENEILNDKSNPEFSFILSAIAVFVLLVACINFINLTIARSVKRAKEIGIRKVIGGNGAQLRMQFLSESFMLCLIAFVLALIIVITVLPVFNGLSNKVLSLSYLFNVPVIMYYIGLFVVTSLLAGCYPAIVLSNYRPIETLYGRFNLAGKSYLQKGLVIFQFALASFLIIGAITIYLQFKYLTTQSLGYDDHDLVTVNKFPLSPNEAALFKQQLLKNPDIVAVAPKNGGDDNNTVKVNGDNKVNTAVETIDTSYLPLLKIPVIAGRNFSAEYPSDATHSALINETFVLQAGWKRPVGEQIKTFNGETYTVVGVVKDHHYKALTEKIEPQFFTMNPANSYGMLYIKIKPGTETASLQYISRTFKALAPYSPFIYNFKQDQNERSYAAEARWKEIILFSAVLTIFISCIGLFGLSVLSVEKRVKEIGVRKVLGASVSGIIAILSVDFLKLILISLVISIPFAWMATNNWLQHYPYRIMLSWWLFLAGSLLVIFIALITISFQSVKAAVANPVKSLRAD